MDKEKKPKEKLDLDKLDIDNLITETVISSRLGRTLASLGAILTGREKHDAKLVYLLLKAERQYSHKLPALAKISEYPKLKKYTPAEAIEWFSQKYPREAEPLLRKLEERYKESKTNLIYGIKDRKDFPDKKYVENLSGLLNITEDRATTLYHSIIKPLLEKEEKESRLVSLAMTDKEKD